MKTAIVCDWLVTFAGAEKVLTALIDCFPGADLFAIIDFLTPENRALIKNKKATTTFIQNLPLAQKHYRSYLPLMPLAIEQLNLMDYDLVISSSHAVAKGVITRPDQVHISYVHTPIRYAWDMQHAYLKDAGFNFLKNFLAKIILHRLRLWDQSSAYRVDHFVANSHFIAKRIHKIYRRDATVIHPPVDLSTFTPNAEPKEDFYLAASRMVAYKKMALIAESFTHMPDKKLIIIGDGPEYKSIKKYARSNIQILGYQPTAVLANYLQRAKAYIFAAEEDFGIMPLEAQASGTPVIAFGKGGALETIRGLPQANPTGVFFFEQTIKSLQLAIYAFEANISLYSPQNCIEQAKSFAPQLFKEKFLKFVNEKIELLTNPSVI